MSVRFKLKPVAKAILLLMCTSKASLSMAQDNPQDNIDAEQTEQQEKKAQDPALEVIEVKGYRGSLQKSINEKRLNDSVSDSIFAEDIGKSTDQNIADALSRVTGVTVQQSDGEGSRISVRGAASSLNQVSLNGVALTSSLSGSGNENSESDQSVDLSTFSSDILSSINVIKTAAADHDEGSLGANVILKTVKPLNVQQNKRIVEVQGRLNEFSDDGDHKLSGTFSEKFFDESFGFIATVSNETQGSRTDALGGHWNTPYIVADVRAGGAKSQQTGEVITEAQKAIIAKERNYSTSINRRERTTATMGFQLLPGEDTDLQFDISYSKQTVAQDSHTVGVNMPDLDNDGNYVVGDIDHLGNKVDFNDPQHQWWTVDEQNHTVVKALNRNGTGRLARSVGGNETENKVATFTAEHFITENLVMNLKAGYSSTTYASLPNATLSTGHWNTVPRQVTKATSLEQLEPIGYDCSAGPCQLVVGTEPFIFVPGGSSNGAQNSATAGFNPLDPHAQHLSYVAQYDESTSDVNKSVFVDFDYTLDNLYIPRIEFGVKYSNRIKDVYTNYQTLEGPGVTVFDPETGEPIKGAAVSDIKMVDVITGAGLPVDNFMDGIAGDYGYNNDFLNGWGVLDPNKAFAEIFQIDNVKIQPDDTGSRKIDMDTAAAYGKLNFELVDGHLTGNIGIRYIYDKHMASSTTGVKFYNRDNIFDANQMIYGNQLANSSLAACSQVTQANQTIPVEEPCYEPLLAPNGELLVSYDEFGNVVSIDQNDPSTRSWWQLFRHNDPTTQKQFGSLYYPDDPDQIWKRTFAETATSSSSVWLPSLNLNYQINDEMIGRFAASKTMARPKFDSLRPGFKYTETVWGDGVSRATVFNPYLKPLESTNLDLSFEWYFGKTNMVSLALFRKDMVNLEEQVNDKVHYLDIRSDYSRDALTWDEFAMPIEDDHSPMVANCMPSRMVQDKIRNPLDFSCDKLNASVIRNGKGALTQGLEFTYSQDLSFLPGMLAHLGTSFNYTFQDSKQDPDVLELTGNKLKALPQAYTPKHSANTTLYWEKSGHQIRLSHRFSDIQLINRSMNQGAEWKDATHFLDLSASYKFSQSITFSLHALNLTDEVSRTFFTSTEMDLGLVDGQGNSIVFDEGNAMNGETDTSRTLRQWKTGRQFRLTARINF
ncbi:TonB-dependent receptor [Paraferrimonas sp. SM1919]|uniref:TonB-dependent receptor n=1 Tax=Paraferrimonas sp. SM1919 TaxID=2662263 RepID=UPI0013D84E6E|nr:TonB-dependent receptor [Paraferrimonas sp. SM1919]